RCWLPSSAALVSVSSATPAEGNVPLARGRQSQTNVFVHQGHVEPRFVGKAVGSGRDRFEIGRR
ncbi:MAG TPA: hypothetical protein VIY28_17675, partial [Pseudonocardiaceae bacterium]